MDARYGCAVCPVLPHPGYLDRLRKGRDRSKHTYSLQHHVETHHPTILDWMTLRTNLPPFRRPGTRGGRTLRPAPTPVVDSSSESEEDELEYDEGDDEEEQEEVEEAAGDDYGSADDNNRGSKKGKRRANADDEEDSDVNMADASPPKKVRQNPNPPSAGVQVAPTSAVQPRPAPRGPTLAGFMNASLITGGYPNPPFQRQTTMDGLRDQNLLLATANQEFLRVNTSLREEVRSLLYVLTNVMEASLVGNPPTAPIVQTGLSVYARGDGQIVERYVARITSELIDRHDAAHAPVTAATAAPQTQQSTNAYLMPPPARPNRPVTPPRQAPASPQAPEISPLSEPEEESDEDEDPIRVRQPRRRR